MRLYEKRRRQRKKRKLILLAIFAVLAMLLIILLTLGLKTRYEAPDEPIRASKVVPKTRPMVMAVQEADPIAVEPEHLYPEFSYSKDWSAEDSYLMAKIAMAEAEGESIQGKTLVILVVLNRVHSEGFPSTIRDVIFEKNQFSPVSNGRFDKVEPDADCWEAVSTVMEAQYDYSGGALYFESNNDTGSWHSRNLKFLYQCGNHKFYK